MKYGLCKACKYFVESRKTELERWPNHCKNEALQDYFGIYDGFISGTDIFACDYFEQHDKYCGDVLIHLKKGGCVSYVKTRERKEKQQYILTDNSKNIKEFFEDDKKHEFKPKGGAVHMEKNH